MQTRTRVVILLLTAVCVACSDSPTPRRVRLQSLAAPGPADPTYATGESRSVAPLRVAIAAVVSPRASYRYYDDLLAYLSDRLGRPVRRVQRSTYAEVNNLMRHGGAEVGLVCTLAYVLGNRDFGMELLAAPVVAGQQVYYSYTIVPNDSTAQSVSDLAGTVFAFTDPLSNSGRLSPLFALRQLGHAPDTFFGRYIFTYSHDNSIRAVADGFVDAAAVDSLIYDAMVESDAAIGSHLKVIATSPAYGIPPVVVHPAMEPRTKDDVRSIFFEMDQDPQGRVILATLDIDRFAPIDDSAYDSVREMIAAVDLGL